MYQNIDPSKKSILITDDDPSIRRFLENMLEGAGYKSITAVDGKHCIEITKILIPDLILMDITMPFMNGIETCKIIKDNPKTKNVPVIFVTANSEDINLIDAFEAGGTDYVRKPVNETDLLARIKATLTQQELNKLSIEDEKLKAILEMAGGICHELNQPLQVISGNSQLMLMNLKENDTNYKQIITIKNNVQKMADIIKKLMEITTIETVDYVGRGKIIDINKSYNNNDG